MLELVKKNREIIAICVLYGIISLVLFFLMFDGNTIITPDSPGYIALANNLLSRGFFSMDGINPDYLRTPGYPLFLALVYMLGGGGVLPLFLYRLY
jgi:hypothetical protein